MTTNGTKSKRAAAAIEATSDPLAEKPIAIGHHLAHDGYEWEITGMVPTLFLKILVK